MAETEMCLIHHLSNCLIITSFESIADVQYALNLTDHILCSEEILLRNQVSDFFEPYTFGITEELHVAVILSDGSTYVLT